MKWTRNVFTRGLLVTIALGGIGVGFYFQNFLFRENLHTVVEGKLYRSAQPSPEGLSKWIESKGLRSVINLKGGAAEDRASNATIQTALRANLNIQYVRLSARRWPSPAEVEQIITALDTATPPVLLHCQGGTDRSGLASAIAVLLGGQSVDRAREQFAIRYGYPGATLGSDLPGFLESYQHWLDADNVPHTPGRFRRWAATDYVAYFYEAEIEIASPSTRPTAGEAFAFEVRVTNRSAQAIPMHCDEGVGVRLSMRLRVVEPDPRPLRERRFCSDKGPLAPGASAIITASGYKLGTAGRYEFRADLVDEKNEHLFVDMGSQLATHTITVY
ncbi:MAG: protein tyrosine/serine phosphatase [Myxococcota bacterium]|jgi:protein tyrosine/serine phosphatase